VISQFREVEFIPQTIRLSHLWVTKFEIGIKKIFVDNSCHENHKMRAEQRSLAIGKYVKSIIVKLMKVNNAK